MPVVADCRMKAVDFSTVIGFQVDGGMHGIMQGILIRRVKFEVVLSTALSFWGGGGWALNLTFGS